MSASKPQDEVSVVETTETDHGESKPEASTVTNEQWNAMKAIMETLVNYRDADGHDPSRIFHKKVNRRFTPSYYDVIKEPVAISTLKARWAGKEYSTFAEFVRECALIWHNAHTYNRPDAGAYVDATALKALMEAEFQKLVTTKIISPEVAAWPDLGEIPPVEDLPEDEEDEDDEEDEEDEEDEDADESEEEGKKKRRRGRVSMHKREARDDGQKEVSSKRKRGRPPKVDTPMEARIKNVLKGIRKPKNDQGQIMIHHFEKLPDKQAMPEYYVEIKEPIAIELIKRKQKRKKYQSVDHFMRDIDTMFNNAKTYNEDDSQIYKDAIILSETAHRLAEIEKQKSDAEFVMEEGRIPLPNGIVHNNQLWKVGDWIHLQNPNDVTKPIVAQIYRTWQDVDGHKWVNACWYYRPEQTVHQYEKHFFPHEVVKTGQYRDHQIDEIVDRCFVMFFTRFSKGRPRGLAPETEVYVCEARYNEEKKKLNKIKTWASCLPDEVRDKDYEMDVWDTQKKVKKIPSPLLHLLKDDAVATDEPPEPSWGAENAPPIIGGIYKGPRDENQSPPPERTPTPPPPPPPAPVRQMPTPSGYEPAAFRRNGDAAGADERGGTFASTPASQAVRPPHPHQTHSHDYATLQPSSTPLQYHQHTSHQAAQTPPSQYNGFTPGPPAHPESYGSSSRPGHLPVLHRGHPLPLPPAGQRSADAFHLSDAANLAIPEHIRSQYKRDEAGHVLFFTQPPLDVIEPRTESSRFAHTARYLAEKLRRSGVLREDTAAEEMQRRRVEAAVETTKRKLEVDVVPAHEIKEVQDLAIQALVRQMDDATNATYKNIYGDRWTEGKAVELERLALRQAENRRDFEQLERSRCQREEAVRAHQEQLFKGPPGGVFLDDIDPRY